MSAKSQRHHHRRINLMPNEQLVFELAGRPAQGRGDFLVSACNRSAVQLIDAFPDWPDLILALIGPVSSGKTHLANVLKTHVDVVTVLRTDLTDAAVPELCAHELIILEQAENEGDEAAFFHLINYARETKTHMLVLARQSPTRWAIALPDLKSRLAQLHVVELSDPDDELMGGLLFKHFSDRQLRPDTNVIPYILTRIERSFDAVDQVVAAIDQLSLAKKARISRNVARQVLENMGFSSD